MGLHQNRRHSSNFLSSSPSLTSPSLSSLFSLYPSSSVNIPPSSSVKCGKQEEGMGGESFQFCQALMTHKKNSYILGQNFRKSGDGRKKTFRIFCLYVLFLFFNFTLINTVFYRVLSILILLLFFFIFFHILYLFIPSVAPFL